MDIAFVLASLEHMKTFSNLLDTLIAAPVEKKPELEKFINDAYQQEKIVFALDMSGFTTSVQRDGILAHLCRIRRMQLMTAPIVKAHQGELVKYEADNLLAIFTDVTHAIQAAIEMNQAALEENVENDRRISFSIGLDVGKIILLDGVDCFGDAVNLSHKLGEDVARPGEILISEKIHALLPGDHAFTVEKMSVSFSGLTVPAYGVSF